MTKAELIERIARSRDLPPDITKKDIAKVLGLAFDELASYFSKSKVTRSSSPRFTFPRFGTFTKKRRNARRGVNPRTLEPMQIDACHTLDFKASRELRDAMNPEAPDTDVKGGESRGGGQGRSGVKRASKKKKVKTAKTGSVTPRRDVDTELTKRGATTTRKRGRLAPRAVGAARCPTPRDEEAELDAILGDGAGRLAEDLPESPLQRVRPAGSNSRARTV